jgi:carbamoyltransferase
MYLGFPYYGDEYKVMGLAPYGEPEFADFFRKMIRPKGGHVRTESGLLHASQERCRMAWNDGAPVIEPFYSQKLIDELGPVRDRKDPMTPRHDNIAKSLQVVTEEIIMHLLNRPACKDLGDNLCMTGGVAMNSVANGKITTLTPFKNVYIPAGAADNGTSFGAAFYVWNHLLKKPRTFVQDHAYWGCSSTDAEAIDAAVAAGVPLNSWMKSRWSIEPPI